MQEKKTKTVVRWAGAKRVLLCCCVLAYVCLFASALARPSSPGLTEVSSVSVIDTPRPVLLLPTTPPAPESPAALEMRKLDLNQADAWMLCAVPGIGEETAKRIIEYRDAVDGFTELSELKRVPGIGEATYERILPYLDCGN